ncbi:ATPase [Tsuneonella mangrovi]|uniref:F0F1 ATP synthase subunit B family protein n=1 Tax=Tsuneonella mangrovi TaxID=1982042 RepID=UPI000BA294AB|nr:ATPase [Tsuneonella mangrovi]
MPQLTQLLVVYQSQWFWLLVTLGIIYFGIARRMVPQIEKVVEDRDAKIAGDLAAAEKARAEAEDVHDKALAAEAEAHADARTIAAEAKAKSQADAEKRVAKADAAISEKIAAADARIAEARSKALESIEAVAAEAAQDIVAKVSGAKVTAAKAGTAVKAVMTNG